MTEQCDSKSHLHQISIPGLPDGWRAVAYRVPKGNIEFVFIENVVRKAKPQDKKCLIVEKIQPRRIVLEETKSWSIESMDGYVLVPASQLISMLDIEESLADWQCYMVVEEE